MHIRAQKTAGGVPYLQAARTVPGLLSLQLLGHFSGVCAAFNFIKIIWISPFFLLPFCPCLPFSSFSLLHLLSSKSSNYSHRSLGEGVGGAVVVLSLETFRPGKRGHLLKSRQVLF